MEPTGRPKEVRQPEAQAAQPAAPHKGEGALNKVVKTVAIVGLVTAAFGAFSYARSKAEPDPAHERWEDTKDSVRGVAAQVARGVGANKHS